MELYQVTTFHSSFKIVAITKRSVVHQHHHMNVSTTNRTAGTHSNNCVDASGAEMSMGAWNKCYSMMKHTSQQSPIGTGACNVELWRCRWRRGTQVANISLWATCFCFRVLQFHVLHFHAMQQLVRHFMSVIFTPCIFSAPILTYSFFFIRK